MSKQRTRVELLDPNKFKIPLRAFSKELTPLETTIMYLKEEYLLNYVAIAALIDRDERSIGIAYRRAQKKGSVNHKGKGLRIPVVILRKKDKSPAENIAHYLYDQGLTYAEIARQLEKDQRSIWTLINRKKPNTHL